MTLEEKLKEIQAIIEIKRENADLQSESEIRYIENSINFVLFDARATLTEWGQEILQEKLNEEPLGKTDKL